jgi:hypothetical protein
MPTPTANEVPPQSETPGLIAVSDEGSLPGENVLKPELCWCPVGRGFSMGKYEVTQSQ